MKHAFRSRETKPAHAGDKNCQRGRLYLSFFPPRSYESQHTADFLAAFSDRVHRFGPLQSRAVDLEGKKIAREMNHRMIIGAQYSANPMSESGKDNLETRFSRALLVRDGVCILAEYMDLDSET